jgi:small subunit ribosomal protein S1
MATSAAPRRVRVALGGDPFVSTFDRRGTAVYESAASVPTPPESHEDRPGDDPVDETTSSAAESIEAPLPHQGSSAGDDVSGDTAPMNDDEHRAPTEAQAPAEPSAPSVVDHPRESGDEHEQAGDAAAESHASQGAPLVPNGPEPAATPPHDEQPAAASTHDDESADVAHHGSASATPQHGREPAALGHGEQPVAALVQGDPPRSALVAGEQPVAAISPTERTAPEPGDGPTEQTPTVPASERSGQAVGEAPSRPTIPVPPVGGTSPGRPPIPAPPVGASDEPLPAPRARPAAAGQVAPTDAGEAFASGQLVTGTVVSVDANEVVVDLGDRQGVIGRRHLTPDGKVEPSEVVKVGDEIEAAVLVREDPRNRVVLSHMWAVKQRAWQAVDEAMARNQPISGTVAEAVKGGVVVDIGIRAFLPASQLDVVHVDDLASWIGRPVEAMVAEADRTTDKVVLSRRAFLRQQDRQRANELLASLAPGQVRRGRVATVTDFGAFVDLGGVRGLLHLSELSWERVERTTDVVRVGEEVDVKILSVKGGAKRISLSLRALTPDPLEELAEGQMLQGVVTRLVDFGAFVRVLERIEGLVHVSELAEYRVHLPEEVVTPGDEVWVKVIRIDRRRRRVDLSVNQAVQY